jgi:predicted glycosyltransferase
LRRIVLYSHDTFGLGHLRRNLLIARQLASSSTPTAILLISGTSQASAFEFPPGVDCLSLPGVCKRDDGSYDARRLGIETSSLISFRSTMIRAAVAEFDPDVLIVDKVPRGVLRELDATLRLLRASGHTRCVLGLRDILDDPASVRSEWLDDANEAAIQEFYDAIWVYGDANVYDIAAEYAFSDAVVEKLRYTGYLDPRVGTHANSTDLVEGGSLPVSPARRLAVCLVGGGEDGARLASAFANTVLPIDMEGVILAGPFMPFHLFKSLQQTAARSRKLRVLRFLDEPNGLVSCADRVIAMAGYNTICEVLCHRKRALVVPRIRPRSEQWIRACRLEALGLLEVLHPDGLSAGRLTDWLTQDCQASLPGATCIDFNGLSCLESLLESLCSRSSVSGRKENCTLFVSSAAWRNCWGLQ